MTTQYNILDLPQKHTVGTGSVVVDYKYAADGRKLQEKVKEGRFQQTSRDYGGEFIYENGTLKKILFDGGYVDMTGDSPVYMFFIKDHLGSVRAVVTESGEVVQTNEYYPFGDLFGNSGTGSSSNRFRFTGKELSAETGLYDFSARFLHTRFGRFTTIDPLAEKLSAQAERKVKRQKDAGDLQERTGELRKSVLDIQYMRNEMDSEVIYLYF